jgi:hypothetical protein
MFDSENWKRRKRQTFLFGNPGRKNDMFVIASLLHEMRASKRPEINGASG